MADKEQLVLADFDRKKFLRLASKYLAAGFINGN
jgi:hypothetical protein